MKNNELPDDSDTIENIFTILKSFIFVLTKWNSEIFIKNVQTANHLDVSMINDLEVIVNIWLNKHDEVEFQEINFF